VDWIQYPIFFTVRQGPRPPRSGCSPQKHDSRGARLGRFESGAV